MANPYLEEILDNAIISMSLNICNELLYRSEYPYKLQEELRNRIERLIKEYDNRSADAARRSQVSSL